MPIKSVRVEDLLPTQIEEIIALYKDQKFTIKEIATKTNQKPHLINKVLVANNVPWNRKYLKDLTEEQEEAVLTAFDDGIIIKKIAKGLDISSPAISRLLKKHNKHIVSVHNKYDHLRSQSFSREQKEVLE